MALKKTITISGVSYVLGNGINIKTGPKTVKTSPLYIKVESLVGNKEHVKFDVTFKDEETGEILKRERYPFVPTMDGGNFIAQAYEYLKTLPEFEDAEDC